MTDIQDQPLAIPETVDAGFLIAVGQRVRDARLAAGISRRALSDLSGVSQRYLANLEGGIGNISIGLLKRIAEALKRPVEAFVADDATFSGASDDVARLIELYSAASQTDRRRVLDILEAPAVSSLKGQRVALIGLRGAGKSTLGRLSAAELQVPFVEPSYGRHSGDRGHGAVWPGGLSPAGAAGGRESRRIG
jgi:XRE family aerobic/anaerobic benzoate catabolism transcriptional regulator